MVCPEASIAKELPSKSNWSADAVWRGTQVQNDPGSFRDENGNWILMVQIPLQIFVGPDILTDGNPDFCSQELDRLLILSWIEVSGLIKHVIGWQQRLENLSHGFLFHQHAAGIDERFARLRGIEINITDEEWNTPHGSPELIE
jgi:hypothetical protein